MRLLRKGFVLACILAVVVVSFHYKEDFARNKITVIQEGIKDFSSSYVRTDGDRAYIKLKGKWVNAEDIKIASWNAFEPIYLEYDGAEIYIGDSGLVNVIKFLSEAGLVEDVKSSK